jgi:hypothetical protein
MAAVMGRPICRQRLCEEIQDGVEATIVRRWNEWMGEPYVGYDLEGISWLYSVSIRPLVLHMFRASRHGAYRWLKEKCLRCRGLHVSFAAWNLHRSLAASTATNDQTARYTQSGRASIWHS